MITTRFFSTYHDQGTILPGSFNPSEKYARQFGSFPQVWGEHRKMLKTTTQSQGIYVFPYNKKTSSLFHSMALEGNSSASKDSETTRLLQVWDLPIPEDPCMVYSPTLGEKWQHSRGNCRSIFQSHGSYGYQRVGGGKTEFHRSTF